MGKIIVVTNQKGGTGKTTTTVNLAGALTKLGRKVLAVDLDPQASLTICMGITNPDAISNTIADAMVGVIEENEIPTQSLIRKNEEGIFFIPTNLELSALEQNLINVYCREFVLKSFISQLKESYDYILIDNPPSLSMLTINSLACADSVIIPVQPEYLSIKGFQDLIGTIHRVEKKINPSLQVEGILMNRVDMRTRNTRMLVERFSDAYGGNLRIFKTMIPESVRVTESSQTGGSMCVYDPLGKITQAYEVFAKEVIGNEGKC